MRYSCIHINIARSFALALGITVLLLAIAVPALTNTRASASSRKRVIEVSLLNDQKAPVPEEMVLKLFSAASEEYSEMVGIELKAVEFIPYSGDLALHPMDQAFLLSRLSTRGEIRIIFSNNGGRDENSLSADKESKNRLAGSSHPYFGHIIIFDVGRRASKTDRAGNPALLTVIKHEVAHLFGAEHSKDTDSFMSTPSSLSLGRWTEETIRQIKEHRRKRWFPNC